METRRTGTLILAVCFLAAACSGGATPAVTTTAPVTTTTHGTTTTTSTTTTSSTTTTTTTTLPSRLEARQLAYALEEMHGLHYDLTQAFAMRTITDDPRGTFSGTWLADADYTGETEGTIGFRWVPRSVGEGKFVITRDTTVASMHLVGAMGENDIDMTLSGPQVAGSTFAIAPSTLTIDTLGNVLAEASYWGELQSLSSPSPLNQSFASGWVGPPFPSYAVGEGDTWTTSIATILPFGDADAPISTEVEATITGQEVYEGTPVFIIDVTYRTGAFQFGMRELLDLLAAAPPEELAALGFDLAELEQAAAQIAASGSDIAYSFDATTYRSTLRFDPAAGIVLTRTDTASTLMTMAMTSPQGGAGVSIDIDLTQDLALSSVDRPTELVIPGEPPVAVVEIRSGAFHPAVLELDPAVWTVIRWENTDTDRTYVVTAKDGEFESPPIPPGGSWELDVSEFEPGIYRYYTVIGEARAPASFEIVPAK
jgi:hypothetical protein